MNPPLRNRRAQTRFFLAFVHRVTFRTLLLLAAVCVLLFGGSTIVHAQSALDGFDPNANGAIRVIVVQPDGKILIGGEFTILAPNSGATITRNHIARLNPDGNVDATFDPNANGAVYAIAVQADGKIVVGGNFSGANSIGGQSRNYVARLDATTGAADSFDPNASLPVFAVAVQSDGKIVVGGLFNGANSIGGQTRNFIARLDATTGAADSFDPNANSYVSALLVQPNDKIVIAGDFSGANSIGGQTRNRIARLDPMTGLADSFDPNANSTVLSLTQEADGKIIAGGDFSGPNSIGGQTRNFIARLHPVTGVADSFDPDASSVVFAVAVQPDGKILAGGSFTTIGAQTRNHMARLNPASGLADSYDPSMSSTVFAIAVQQDNKVLAGGDFSAASPIGGAAVTRNNIARLEKDGRLDRTLDDLGPQPGEAFASAVQPDGKMLIGGTFTTVFGVARNHIARLNTDGTLDTGFDPNADNGIRSFIVQADGKILVNGDFTSIGGQPRNRIARLDGTTGLADSFAPSPNDVVWTIALQADGKVLAAGNFTSISGQTRRIARLDATTGLPDSFNPIATSSVLSIAEQADGKILVGGTGSFSATGGQQRHRIARLDPTTGLADSFDPNANDAVYSIAMQTDGKILAGGHFNHFLGATTIGGQTRDYIARLDPITGLADSLNAHVIGHSNPNDSVLSIVVQADGKILISGFFMSIDGQTRNNIARFDGITGLADPFNPNASTPFAFIYDVTLQADGKILAAGGFSSIGGQPRDAGLARLSNDNAALQNLAVTQTTVTWTCGGSTPQFTRVTFEYSNDNVNYTPLGNGTAAGNNWILTGLTLPTGQNFYIRARGRYRGGWSCGSESITESVRNAFIFAPTRVVSRKIHGSAGAFDIDLPLTGSPGVECRSGGASGDHQVVFTFASATTLDNAVISGGAGSVSGISGSGTETITVNLTGITNAQTISIGLLGASNGANTSNFVVPMGVLLGDTSGNGVVNSSDITKTKGQAGVLLNDHNFREDVNANGSINATDIGIVKSMSGTALPTGSEATVLSKHGLVASPDR